MLQVVSFTCHSLLLSIAIGLQERRMFSHLYKVDLSFDYSSNSHVFRPSENYCRHEHHHRARIYGLARLVHLNQQPDGAERVMSCHKNPS